MSQEKTVLGNFHRPSTDLHPTESLGNQQVFCNREQVGSLEFIPNPLTTSLNIVLNNTKGEKIFDLD